MQMDDCNSHPKTFSHCSIATGRKAEGQNRRDCTFF